MRILVLDANVTYINPTRINLPYFLCALGDVVFFGPGYIDRSELNAGIKSFIKKYGPFDIAIHTEQALPKRMWQETASRFESDVFEFYFAGNVAAFDKEELDCFWSDVEATIELVPLNVLSLMLWDYQGTTDIQLAYLSEKYDLVLGLGDELWDQTVIDRNPNAMGYESNSNWSFFLKEYPNKIHSALHYIAPQEFSFALRSSRCRDWSVLGASYEARKAARSFLRGADIDTDDGRTLSHYFRAARYRLGFQQRPTKRSIAKLNSSFFNSLQGSKNSYTCGSVYKMPIRKFFEIPAAGAVLVCDPCHGLDALGFVDGENCIVAQPEELPDVHKWLEINTDLANAIAKSGQRLVLEKHSLDVRANQLREALVRLLDKKFFGSFWEGGELKYRAQ